MYQKFTDRAKHILRLADMEAHRFNYEYVQPEHLLLGLVKEGNGVGANLLQSNGYELRRVRMEVEKLIKPSQDLVTMGRLPHSPSTRQCLEHAVEVARDMNSALVGSEHLLLGVIREPSDVTSQVFQTLGVKYHHLLEQTKYLASKSSG